MARTIMIEGPSGRGKSFSLRNLPPKYTLIANHERKTLPFKGAEAFPQVRPLNVKETFEVMDKAIAEVNTRYEVTTMIARIATDTSHSKISLRVDFFMIQLYLTKY